MSDQETFGASRALTLSDLKANTILPSSTFLNGTLMELSKRAYKADGTEGSHPTTTEALFVRVKTSLLNDTRLVNDYVPPSSAQSIKCSISMTLTLDDNVSRKLDEGAQRDLIIRYRDRLKEGVAQSLRISTEAMHVAAMRMGKKPEIELEGSGMRWVQSKSDTPFMLFENAPAQIDDLRAGTPQWLRSPSPGPSAKVNSGRLGREPTGSKPRPSDSSSVTLALEQASKVDRLRPVSAHQLPQSRRSVPLKTTSRANSLASERQSNRAESPIKAAYKHKAAESDPSPIDVDIEDEPTSQTSSNKKVIRSRVGNIDSPQTAPRMSQGETSDIPYASVPTRAAEKRSRSIAGDDEEAEEERPAKAKKTAPLARTTTAVSSSSRATSGGSAPNTDQAYVRPVPRSSSPLTSLPPESDGIDLEAESSAGARRRQAEKEVSSKRRSEAEARAKRDADAKRSEQEKMRNAAMADLERLKRPFSSSVHDYTPLGSLQSRQRANVVGVIVEVKPPRKSKDWSMTVVIADPTTHIEGTGSEDVPVTIFRRNEEDLPRGLSPGLPMLFRGLMISEWNGKLKGQAYSGEANTWATLPGGKKLRVAVEQDMIPPIEDVETNRLLALHKWWSTVGEYGTGYVDEWDADGASDRTSSTSPGKRRDITLGEARVGMFFNATFKILYVYHNGRNVFMEVYITDGTTSSERLRNFHNFQDKVPYNAIFCLSIHEKPPDNELELFKKGNILKMGNVRAKLYKEDLELTWSEKLTQEQVEMGWRTRRRCELIPNEDERARVINTRINAWERGQVPPDAAPAAAEQLPTSGSSPAKPPNEVMLAKHLSTTFTDEFDYPIATLADVKVNQLIPNKFRVRARVKSLHTRGVPGNKTYVQRHCLHCRRHFATPHCQSCNDLKCEKATYVYRFIAIIEQDDTELSLMIADKQAESFLPQLPPLSASNNPNDIKRHQIRLKEISARVDGILLGKMFDGQRTRPIIDWTIQCLELDIKGKPGETVKVWTPFGMRSIEHSSPA